MPCTAYLLLQADVPSCFPVAPVGGGAQSSSTIIHVMFWGVRIAPIATILNHANHVSRKSRCGLRRWLEARNLPRHMRAEITAYYSDIWTRHTGASETVV